MIYPNGQVKKGVYTAGQKVKDLEMSQEEERVQRETNEARLLKERKDREHERQLKRDQVHQARENNKKIYGGSSNNGQSPAPDSAQKAKI
jgi:hypothetical protein